MPARSDREPRREATRQRRADILSAALETFNDVGDSGTFIQQVCSRAGVSVGTVYHHFGSKDQLIATLHYTLLNDYQSGAGPILADNPSAEDGVRQTVDYHVRWLIGHPSEASFILQQPFAGYRSDNVPTSLTEENDDFLASVRTWLHAKMQEGELRKLPFETVVALLIGPIHHWARSALFLGRARAVRHLESAAVELSDGVWQSLRPVDPRSARPSGTRRTT